jgi:hypothetical protein
MTTPVRFRAVIIGAAAGLLSTVLGGMVASLLAGVLGATDPFSSGLVIGALLGLFVAGFTAAKFVFQNGPLHGSLAALLTVAVVGTDALLRGSGATPLTLAGFALLAALFGAVGGYVGGRGER